MVINMSELNVANNVAAGAENRMPAAGSSAPYMVVGLKREDTEQTKKMKANFTFFGPVTFLYAVFYAFCMYKNGSGITFPFFIVGSLLYLCFCLDKLTVTLKKGSAFYMISMVLLGISTFCTDDWRIIALNKTGIFFLMMSLLLKQFYDTSKWRLGKYLVSICEMVFLSLEELRSPFADGKAYFKSGANKTNKKVWYAVLGLVIAVPLFFIVLLLLSSADAVFRELTRAFLEEINVGNILNVLFRIGFIFLASYLLVAHLCKHTIKEDVKDRRTGEPILAITITGLLSLLYMVFSGIQIIYLFLGKMQLPAEYTYAEYAREGFFQLLTVSVLNLIIVLISMTYFRKSQVLKAILTIMSLCTFVMIASSVLRMIMYIRYYYMTFLRIFVLWALAVLFLMFVGVVISIYREKMQLFRYSMVVVTALYLVLAFIHPDYIIAKVNVANAVSSVDAELEDWAGPQNDFFKNDEPYSDYSYLSYLSADAAPVLIPYMAELGYDMELFYEEDMWEVLEEEKGNVYRYRYKIENFGYYYLEGLQTKTEKFGLRTYNVSRHRALKCIEEYAK